LKRRGAILFFCVFSLLCLAASAVTGQEFYGPPEPKKDFKKGCVFLGIAKKGSVVAILYFRREEWTPRGVLIKAVLVPTDDFPFESGYRGFRKKEYYRIKKGRSLRLINGESITTFSLKDNVDIADTSALAADFLARKKRKELVPDDIAAIDFNLKDVVRWDKVKKKEIPFWGRSFEEMETADRRRRKQRAGIGDRSTATVQQIDEDEYRGRYATLNGTYIFEKKTVFSPIIAVLDLGDYLAHTKRAGGDWMEVLFGESNIKGYVLSVYLVDDQEEALRWEKEMNLEPVTPPLGPTVSEQAEGDEPTGRH